MMTLSSWHLQCETEPERVFVGEPCHHRSDLISLEGTRHFFAPRREISCHPRSEICPFARFCRFHFPEMQISCALFHRRSLLPNTFQPPSARAMPPTAPQTLPGSEQTLFEAPMPWRAGPAATPAQAGEPMVQQPSPQFSRWPAGAPTGPGAPPQLPPDVQQQLASWYWWSQYASLCQASGGAGAQTIPFGAARPIDGAAFGQTGVMPAFFPFAGPHHVPQQGGGDAPTVSRPVPVRAFTGMHASGISALPIQKPDDAGKRRGDAPARGRRRRSTPENRCCVNCGTHHDARISAAAPHLCAVQAMPSHARDSTRLTYALCTFSAGTTQTPFWRKHKSGGALCNACGARTPPRPRAWLFIVSLYPR